MHSLYQWHLSYAPRAWECAMQPCASAACRANLELLAIPGSSKQQDEHRQLPLTKLGRLVQHQLQHKRHARRIPVPCISAELHASPDPAETPGNSNNRLTGTQVLEGSKPYSVSFLEKELVERISLTGGAFDFIGGAEPLMQRPLEKVKKLVLVRHGLSLWNADSRIQGSSNLSTLSEKGVLQAIKCKNALSQMKFDRCFASPISRAKSSAELIWEGREEPLLFLDTLQEAHLHFLEGMKNEDAKREFPEVYKAWREDPANFYVEGVYPVVELWERARKAWEELLSTEGQCVLVVTHKSILRALICTALGMGPERFRAIDINNGGISTFTVNEKGQPLLQSLNMTAHLHADKVFY